MINIKVYTPRSFETRYLLMGNWYDFWEVYIFFSVNGIPWETSPAQTEKREVEHHPTPHNLCTVALGDISKFPSWISKFVKNYNTTGLNFSITEVPTCIILEKSDSEDIFLKYEYDEFYVPAPVHPHFSAKIKLNELVGQVLALLPATEQILKDMGQEEVLHTSFWKRYMKRYFLNLEKSFNPSYS